MSDFVHLHVHTEYSLLDGSAKVSKIIEKTKELGMKALAITDHGVMYGIVNFYKEAKKQGIKPILGCEIYVVDGDNTSKVRKPLYHLVLLAENEIGYQNLMKIVSESHVNGFYYKPRVNHEYIAKYSEGIIALSACLGGEVQTYLNQGQYEKAKKSALRYKEIFGQDNFYLELQDHGMLEQKEVNNKLIELSEEVDIELVATNDVHYIEKTDAKVHDALLCIQTGKIIKDEERMKFPSDEFYLKSPNEMKSLFPHQLKALQNTVDIADRCEVELDFDTLHLPHFEVPEGYTNQEYLRELCRRGLEERYENITDEIKERLEFELTTIEKMGYVDYFLIVWDFIKYAKDRDIIVGPGRGSAAGSIVSYALDITEIDPLEYNLLFERFLNPERVSMPDIDIDIQDSGRQNVIDYVTEKYGTDKVVQIVTFGTMAARGAIRDVGRVLDLSYGEVDFVAKQIPMELGMTISKALDVSKELAASYENDERIRELIDLAKAVEGLPRHTSTHAAGVVISQEAIDKYVPLSRNGDVITTQYNMTEIEELGLLKMDFLGLRNLTVIQNAAKMVEKQQNKKVSFDDCKYDDPEVYKLFAQGKTLGVFQFESAGMRVFIKELEPKGFEDIIAANALYRPGPMNQIPNFIQNKMDPEQIEYLHPKLKPILGVTYGCMIYQEQVMQVVRDIGGFSMARSDLVRRAMGKKKMKVMEEERKYFIHGKPDETPPIRGAIENGIPENAANKIYDQMIDFAKYAFNKSHSAAYAMVAYQTAWLKCYYPVEFMASLLSSVMGNTSSVSLYIQECKKMDIEVLPPNVNTSFDGFTVDEGRIRFGLSAIKNVGKNAIADIVKARETKGQFVDIVDFIEKVDTTAVNKRAVESLIRCGALDGLKYNRAQMMSAYEKIMNSLSNTKKRNVAGQFSMFETTEVDTFQIPRLVEFDEQSLLNMEKEVLGIFISGHPLSRYEATMEKVASIQIAEIAEALEEEQSSAWDGRKVVLAGIVTSKKQKITKNNNMMAFVSLEDLTGYIECIVFPKIYSKYQQYTEEDQLVIVSGRLNIHEEDEAKLICDKIAPLESVNDTEQKLYVKISPIEQDKRVMLLKETLKRHRGNSPVYIYFEKLKRVVKTDSEFFVDLEDENLIIELKNLLGTENVKFS
ncbi:MAG: DNA polymerase III subunit alpha [Tissierellales bacterium]|nr:DNA polymerase III subunit alpha [Tissierellales bacterium]